MSTGLFHADPHRGNLLRTPDGKLAFIDFGMMADVTEEECYGLVGLTIGLQNKDLSLITENLLKVSKCSLRFDLLVEGNLDVMSQSLSFVLNSLASFEMRRR
jgi:predicted unusual protein kinase regulating ubiquinone biosynthesis (AarF/ABC1/UbiB family)